MFQEFKTFAMRGNVIDLAVGVIIGAAFGKITTSLVNDIFNPIIGIIVGKLNFSGMFVALNFKSYETMEAAQAAGIPVITYGNFLNTIIDFAITAFAIFIMIQQINKLKRREEKKGKTEDPADKKCPYCISTIPVKATRCPNCTSELTVK
ncbi:MAG: large conductance mechanosensitive channel protein MscL [Candidatus Paceibacterota bacterium]